MKRRYFSFTYLLLIAFAAGLMLSSACAFAQSKATVYVPFAFTANHQQLPAGHYQLNLLSDRFLCFSNSKTGEHQAVILVNPEAASYIETRGRLKFIQDNTDRGKQRHYLVDVQFAGSSMHSTTVIRPSLARELAASVTPVSTVEIAMK